MCIRDRSYITDSIGDISYQISPLSFFQVNPIQTEKLYGKALEYAGLTGNETVWDLYCGIGTISLFLAQKAKFVRGVETVSYTHLDVYKRQRLCLAVWFLMSRKTYRRNSRYLRNLPVGSS